jgi:predicted MFS family arabinose efflux permease
MGILAAADPEGRAAAFSLATQYGGLALGASLANFLVRSDEAHAIILVGGLLFGVALVSVIYADRIVGSGQVPMREPV